MRFFYCLATIYMLSITSVPAKANPEVGNNLIKWNYSQLMSFCNEARQLNARGNAYFTEQIRGFMIGRLMNTGNTRIQAEDFSNGVAWAMRRECPDVY